MGGGRFKRAGRKLEFGGDAAQQQPAAVLVPVRFTRLRVIWLPCQFSMRSRPPGATACKKLPVSQGLVGLYCACAVP